MGKPTGFMEYKRVTGECVKPIERIKHFKEPVHQSKQCSMG